MRRLKVAFLIPSLSGGGAERATATIADGLDSTIFDPVLVLERDAPRVYKLSSGLPVETLGATSTRAALRPLIRFVRRKQPDVLYAALPHLNILAAVACRFAHPKPRLVVSVHNNQARELADVPHGGQMRRLMPWVYRAADAIVVVSKGIAQELRPVVDDAAKLRVIYNPIAVDEVAFLASQHVTHPWLDGRHKVITAMGRLTAQKGFRLLLQAFADVYGRRRDARLLILGEGEQRIELEDLSRDLGICEVVDFLGFKENPFSYIALSCCFVLSSHWEGFGMAIVEAMAAGAPILSTDCLYGPAEILEQGRCGLLVRPGSPVDLADGMLRLLEDEKLRQFLVQQGKERGRDFDVVAILPQFSQLLCELGNRAGRCAPQ